MTNAYYLNQFISTTLSTVGGIDDSQTTGIKIASTSGVTTDKPGILCLSYSDPIDITKAEWISYTSIDVSNELQGVTRGEEGFSAKAHSNGVTVAFPISRSHINNLNDALIIDGDETNLVEGVISPSGTSTNPSTELVTKSYADGGLVTSLSRQAIINGNFDVWQRGTSIAFTTANGYASDRWYAETATAGTDKTISRQDGTGVPGSYYCARVAIVQDVDELLTFSQALESQDSIKFRGQKVTLSFYARGGAEFVADNSTLVSKIVTGKGTDQKVLAFTTLADGVSQNNTLTTSWQKFTCTTTSAIASDITQIGISFAFTHAGSGTTTNYFEVTQVQLCAGDVALPFMPKSFEEELRACRAYTYNPFYLDSRSYSFIGLGYGITTTTGMALMNLPVTMRIQPTLLWSGNFRFDNSVDSAPVATSIAITTVKSGLNFVYLEVGAASGIQAKVPFLLERNNDTSAVFLLSSEL